ncbi:glycerol-3-phosphate acyltransferase [Oceanobacillus profundus]|uniref:glycerol-3-phosphate acyltransferase n=1 Tax=Oceanobacillus profundus TaxID=372463 RepID=UPI0021CCCAD3|nr:glycerol-3-phosphate acyltransferase [Oceanobacillus profundus]
MKPLFTFILIFLSYLFGCVNGAYYVGKLAVNQDIRKLGSTNAGARNAGRVLGRSAFIYTVIIDALKTIIPLLIAGYVFTVSSFLLGCAALAVLVGHIWPVQLQFRGGKGVVVYLAAALVLTPLTLIATGVILLIGLCLKSSFTIAGLAALAIIPITLLIISEYILFGIFLLMLIIVLLLHRKGEPR